MDCKEDGVVRVKIVLTKQQLRQLVSTMGSGSSGGRSPTPSVATNDDIFSGGAVVARVKEKAHEEGEAWRLEA
ncbi:hypothetical protein QJS10_CPA01g00331 [Acorus calamus]|uniref:Uncharacterized protein n=1 Tax=Acorus calamus TaxID=4465 RepID=A0AAV9FFR2_ACOCL|nr:hypothetical protein QJS10_CPA01g00331 [Acorus calamus]